VPQKQRAPVDGGEKYGGTQRHSPQKLNRHDRHSLHILCAPDQPGFEAAFAMTQIFYADQLMREFWACGQGSADKEISVSQATHTAQYIFQLFRQFQSNHLAF